LQLKQKINNLKIDILALWFAYRDPRTPWYARIWVAIVVGYAFSPIDLIPDFIPGLGYLDDAILLPIGIFIAIRLIPRDVLKDSRIKAKEWLDGKEKPKSLVAAILIIAFWIFILFLIFHLLIARIRKSA